FGELALAVAGRLTAAPLLAGALDPALELGAGATRRLPAGLDGLTGRGDPIGDLLAELLDGGCDGLLHVAQRGFGGLAPTFGAALEIPPHLLPRSRREEERDARTDEGAPEERAKAAGAAFDHDIRQIFTLGHGTSLGGAASAGVGASWLISIL